MTSKYDDLRAGSSLAASRVSNPPRLYGPHNWCMANGKIELPHSISRSSIGGNLCPAVEQTVVLIRIPQSDSFLFPPSDSCSRAPPLTVCACGGRGMQSQRVDDSKPLHGCRRRFVVTGLLGSEAQTPTAQLGRAYILMLWLAGIIARAAYHDGRCLGKLLGAGKARKYVTSLG